MPDRAGDRAGLRRHGAADAGRVPARERSRGGDHRLARHPGPGPGGVAGPGAAGGPADAVRRRLRDRRLRPLHEGAHPGGQRRRAAALLRLHARDEVAEVRVPGARAAGDRRHDDDDLRQRSHRALPGPRAAEPGALRGGGHPPRRRALQRGGPQVLRAGRAVLGHAALRRLADLRLHRLDELRGHRRRGQGDHGGAPTSASSSAWCSCWSASPSRSRPCRSTCGRPTSTRARRRRSPPSSPRRPRPRRSRC